MSDMRLGGLVTGMDTENLVSQLLEIDRIPYRRLERSKMDLQQRRSSWDNVSADLRSLLDAATSMASTSFWNAREVTSSDADKVTASAGTTARRATYFVTVNQLATASRLEGTGDVGSSIDPDAQLSESGLAATVQAGKFTVNGNVVAVSDGDSLNDVLARIETALPGAATAAYDPASDRIQLDGKGTDVLLGSAADTSNFLEVVGLVADGSTDVVWSARALGVADVDAAINSGGANAGRLRTAVTEGEGAFTVNGVGIAYDTTVDSLADVMARIGDSAAGVEAVFDPQLDRVVLTSTRPGALAVTASDVAGNLVSSLGLDGAATLGSNASVTIEGVNGGAAIWSADNRFTAAETGIEGLTLDVHEAGGPEQVTVGYDSAALRTGVDTFIEAYNSVIDEFEAQTVVDLTDEEPVAGPLQGDWLANSIRREVSQVARRVVDASSDPVALATVGIGSSATTGKLSVLDESVLAQVLAEDPEELARLFSDPDEGVAAKMETLLEARLETSTGAIDRRDQRLLDEMSRLDRTMARLEERFERLEDQYWRQFAAVESATAQLQASSSMVMAMLGIDTSAE